MNLFNNGVGRYQGELGLINKSTRWQVQKNINNLAYTGGLVIID
jgi:hypothetical protein